MGRPRAAAKAREPIFGPPATTPREAFLRFGNACHWALTGQGLELATSPKMLVEATLMKLPRAEHRLVAAFITELTSDAYTFAEADAVWQRSQNDTIWMRWHDAAAYLGFLLLA